MKITFILPMYLSVPSGGFKVVYEYANRLQRRGHQITIVHPRTITVATGAVERVKRYLWKPKLLFKNRQLITWFQVDEDVNLLLVHDLRARFIPEADVIVATAYDTSFQVADYPPEKGKKVYLIQSYETWNGEEAVVQSSWKLPMQKVVISRYLLRLSESFGDIKHTYYIPLGLDLSIFKLLVPIVNRAIPRVGMLAHPNKIKGTEDGIRALVFVKEKIPDLQAVLFGTESRNSDWPTWIEYVQRPIQSGLVELYNSCQVFLNPSWAEGWGLPAAEAMASGCALVSADNGGVGEFAINGESAFIVPIKCPKKLAEKTITLLSDNDLRIKMASAGYETVQKFTWERAVSSLERLFIDISRV